jgi:hypothetical protein
MVGAFITSDPPTQFLVFWLSMFGAGYYQWFVLLPSLGKLEIISLGLIESNTRRADPVVLTRPTTKPRRQRSRRIPAFDKNGLSPLQRAIDKTDREMRSVPAGKGLRSWSLVFGCGLPPGVRRRLAAPQALDLLLGCALVRACPLVEFLKPRHPRPRPNQRRSPTLN